MSVRSAGVLLHITSLPSEFGIGDFGPQAYMFADFLHRSGQRIWQILPLNFVDANANFSPYGSVSSMAVNILLISPELLVADGLISKKDLKNFQLPNTDQVDFSSVVAAKNKMFDLAWENFKSTNDRQLLKQFKKFCRQEKLWLDDFALYSVKKKQQQQKPWWKWEEEPKTKASKFLKRIVTEYSDEIGKIKFLQFLFSRQWKRLRKYCNDRGIKILGDLPYYVSHDSVDVWANPEIFKIDKNGQPIAVAGTPPDMFTDDGQLWNMPVYNWKILKKRNYDWWVERMKKNYQLFDLIRLDHFRGFSAYWEVPAKSPTAKNGEWKKGPSVDFFRKIKKELGSLPFIAEDLGEIDDDVIELREQLRLPGMKVLQFAFGKNISISEHIPHNYEQDFFVFTGTHDNNTTKGWWRKDIDASTKERVKKYCSKELTEENISSELIRQAYASVAKIAVIPIQDILNLDESARMNTPGSLKNNWSWRLLPGQLTSSNEESLNELVKLYNR